MARTQNIVVREGTAETYWYGLVGYLVLAIIGFVWVGYTILTTMERGSSFGTAFMSALGILLISGLGLLTYPALFKDSAYLRGTRAAWNPKWWYYIGGSLAIPVLAYFLFGFLVSPGESSVIAVMTHAVSPAVMCGAYLYRRHQYVGVP